MRRHSGHAGIAGRAPPQNPSPGGLRRGAPAAGKVDVCLLAAAWPSAVVCQAWRNGGGKKNIAQLLSHLGADARGGPLPVQRATNLTAGTGQEARGLPHSVPLGELADLERGVGEAGDKKHIREHHRCLHSKRKQKEEGKQERTSSKARAVNGNWAFVSRRSCVETISHSSRQWKVARLLSYCSRHCVHGRSAL